LKKQGGGFAMKRKTNWICVLSISLILIAIPFSVAFAAPQSIPGGPNRQPNQHVGIERVHSYEELVDTLNQIVQSSQENMLLTWYGPTIQGRYIPLATIGNGPTPVMIIAQQHGGERMTCEAALRAIKHLASAGSPEVKNILEKFTLLIMPRVNVDGAELGTRGNAAGFDINRDHRTTNWPNAYNTFEAKAVRTVWEAYKPMIMMDLHHMGTYTNDDLDLITVNVSRPTNPLSQRPLITPDAYPGWPGFEGKEVKSLSMQIGAELYLTLEAVGFGEVELYTGGNASQDLRIGRNAFGVLGSATQLVEIRGGIGQKSSGYLIELPYRAIMAILESTADGSLFEVDPAIYTNIPPGDLAPEEEEESH
jgi:hypothetical protein